MILNVDEFVLDELLYECDAWICVDCGCTSLDWFHCLSVLSILFLLFLMLPISYAQWFGCADCHSLILLSNPCHRFLMRKYAFCILNTMTMMLDSDGLFHLVIWCCCMYPVISRLHSLWWCGFLLVCCWFCDPWCMCVCVWTAWWSTVCGSPWSACYEPDQLMMYMEGVYDGDWIVGSGRWLCGCSSCVCMSC